MKKLLVLAILLIPAMGWGWEEGPRFPALTREDMEATMPKPTRAYIEGHIPQYEFRRVSYSETGHVWAKAKEIAQIEKYVNQALRENPGWKLTHFFPFTNLGFVRFEFEIIIYLQREVVK